MLLVLLLVARGDEPLSLAADLAVPYAVRLHAEPPANESLVLLPGSYRISWAEGALVFYVATNMLEVGRVAAAGEPSKASGEKALLSQKAKSARVSLVVRLAGLEVKLAGERVSEAASQPASASVGEVEAASLSADLPGVDDPIEQSWRRLRHQISHCSEHAEHSAWSATDQRFERCVCPIALAFRMPKFSLQRNFSLDQRTSVALSVDDFGKVTRCGLERSR